MYVCVSVSLFVFLVSPFPFYHFLSLRVSFYISENLSCIFPPSIHLYTSFSFVLSLSTFFQSNPSSVSISPLPRTFCSFFSFLFLLVRHPSTPDLLCNLSVSLFLHVLGVAYRLPYTINPKCHLLSFLSRGIRSEWRVSGSSYPAFLGLIFSSSLLIGQQESHVPGYALPVQHHHHPIHLLH